jgi:hypothetical protein
MRKYARKDNLYKSLFHVEFSITEAIIKNMLDAGYSKMDLVNVIVCEFMKRPCKWTGPLQKYYFFKNVVQSLEYLERLSINK